jgi:hypothetical protein
MSRVRTPLRPEGEAIQQPTPLGLLGLTILTILTTTMDKHSSRR